MVEKKLQFDRSAVPQETGYWCAPASIQSMLRARGTRVGESEIAHQTEELEGNRGWDDQDGTDSIRQGATVLNRYLPEAEYAVVEWRGYPGRVAREEFWQRVKASVDAGYGVLVNIVAPVSNYPRGTRDSASPAYGGGTVFHYISIAGYYDGPDGRHYWVDDSGFRPFGYWCSHEQMCTLIPPKGYAYPAGASAFLSSLSDAEQRAVWSGFAQFAGPS